MGCAESDLVNTCITMYLGDIKKYNDRFSSVELYKAFEFTAKKLGMLVTQVEKYYEW